MVTEAKFVEKLTLREQEILIALMLGKRRDQIASEFYIGRATVDFHIHNIYGKLNSQAYKNRLGLLYAAINSAYLPYDLRDQLLDALKEGDGYA